MDVGRFESTFRICNQSESAESFRHLLRPSSETIQPRLKFTSGLRQRAPQPPHGSDFLPGVLPIEEHSGEESRLLDPFAGRALKKRFLELGVGKALGRGSAPHRLAPSRRSSAATWQAQSNGSSRPSLVAWSRPEIDASRKRHAVRNESRRARRNVLLEDGLAEGFDSRMSSVQTAARVRQGEAVETSGADVNRLVRIGHTAGSRLTFLCRL